MTDAHIRPDEYRPQWKYRRIVIWSSIAYALAASAWLSYSYAFEARTGTVSVHEVLGYVSLVIAHLGYLAAVTFQYVWGAIQQLKDFFAMLSSIRGGQQPQQPYYQPAYMAHGPMITEAPDENG